MQLQDVGLLVLGFVLVVFILACTAFVATLIEFRRTFGAFPPVINKDKRKRYMQEKIVPKMESLAADIIAARRMQFDMLSSISPSGLNIHNFLNSKADEQEKIASIRFENAEFLLDLLRFRLPTIRVM